MKAFLGGMALGGFLVGAVSYYGIIAPSSEMTEQLINEKLAKAFVDDRPRDERITELLIDSAILFPKLDTPYKHEELLGEGVIAALYKMTPMMTLTADMIDDLCVYYAGHTLGVDTISIAIDLKDPDYYQTMYDKAGIFNGDDEPPLGAFIFSGIRPLTLGRFAADGGYIKNTSSLQLQLTEKDLYTSLAKLRETNPTGTIKQCDGNPISDPEILKEVLEVLERWAIEPSPSKIGEQEAMDD